MKAKVIDIEGVGKAIFGKADGASIEEILNSIKEDIAEAANESKDKEYHDMAFSLPPGIHLDYRSYHQHTGTGGTDTACQKSSQCKQTYINTGGTCEITLHGNIT